MDMNAKNTVRIDIDGRFGQLIYNADGVLTGISSIPGFDGEETESDSILSAYTYLPHPFMKGDAVSFSQRGERVYGVLSFPCDDIIEQQKPGGRWLEDYESGNELIESRATVADYIGALESLFLISNQEAFSVHYRSSTRIGKSAKRHLVDPSLSCASLHLTVEKLLNDHETFGLMFEALVERDLRIYAEYLEGQLYHFRDNASGDEVDAIVEFKNGEYAAFEIKLSDGSIQDAIANLKKFYKNVEKKPAYMCVIVGHLEAIIRDPESGIFIVPATSLKP